MTQKYQNQIWSILALFPIGVCSLLYILFKRDFAKLHLDFSFLNFPVFIGEILLCYAGLVLMVRWAADPPAWNNYYAFAIVYLIWFTIKTVTGYCHWGPLALRHAALFYYPLFFGIGYIFFDRRAMTQWSLRGLFVIIEGALWYSQHDRYWDFTLGCMGLILILGVKDKKWALLMALILVFSFPYLYLFKTARMMFVANTVSLLVLGTASFYLLETRLFFKMLVFILIVAGISLGFYKSLILGESGRMFTPPGEVIAQFKGSDKIVQQKKSSFKKIPLKAALYNTGHDKNELNYNNLQDEVKHLDADKNYIEWNSVNNIVFRLFIWRDMWEDWKTKKPFWGIDFGRPLRSPSLEILDWAQPEWGRDGWIEPHNSYFNMCYRAGYIGIFLVVFIWFELFRFFRAAFRRHSWVLILLAAILLNWMVAANFLLILELPYTAIPFWTLAGMAWAYAYKHEAYVS